jgi:hypothetical protein
MKRNYISPEFNYRKVPGTFNMVEQTSFFGSKMIEIEDTLNILNENLVYYQNTNSEQIDLDSETSFPRIVYDAAKDKSENHTLKLEDSQSDFQKNDKAKWSLNIKLKTIFKNYIFATLKKYRTFEGIKNVMCSSGNVNNAMQEYIDKNIFSRYKLVRVDLYLDYIDLLSNNGLKYQTIFDQNIEDGSRKFPQFQTITAFDESEITLIFNQAKPASQFSFKYYFNIYYEKL